MKLTYLGQCGFLLEGNGTRIVTDPYLSDYVDTHCCTEQVIWKRLYPPMATLGAIRPDGIVISHAHEDHMDPETLMPYARQGGTAVIAAPLPQTKQLQEMGFRQIVNARAEQPFRIGSAIITPIACAHTQFHTDEEGHFRELSYVIDFGEGDRVFFGGDLSLYDGLTERLRAAQPMLLLLPANGRDDWRTQQGIIGNITAAEAADLAGKVGAPWTPMHHDLYQVNRCQPGEPEKVSGRMGVRILPLKPGESMTVVSGRRID